MKILKLSPYYSPEIISSSHLTKDLDKAFVDVGANITIIAPIPTRGLSKKKYKEFRKKKYQEFYDGKIKLYRFFMFREHSFVLLRIIRYLLVNIIQYQKAIKEKNVDILFSSSTPPTQGLLCSLVKKKINKNNNCSLKFIYVLQDVFPDSLVSSSLIKMGSVVWKIGRHIENFTYINADKIIVISNDFKKNLLSKNVPENKIVVINNWIDYNKVQYVKRAQNTLFEKFNLDRNKFYINYCGNIGLSQNFDLLLKVAKRLEPIFDIIFVLIGEGAYKSQIIDKIEKEKICNVKVFPFQPYEDISSVFSLGDIGLIISKPNVGLNSVPSKTWSIMSAERPIIASFDVNSELSKIIVSADCGICVDPNEEDLFYKNIIYLYNNRELIKEMGRNGRKYIIENFSKEITVEKYVEIISKLESTKL